MGGLTFANLFLVISVKRSQLAFLKLMYSLCLLKVGLISGSKKRVMRFAREMSGEVGCPLVGHLVGVSVFRTPMLESAISSDNKLPLVSSMDDHQRGSWAVMSPRTKVSESLRSGLMSRLWLGLQFEVGGMYSGPGLHLCLSVCLS